MNFHILALKAGNDFIVIVYIVHEWKISIVIALGCPQMVLKKKRLESYRGMAKQTASSRAIKTSLGQNVLETVFGVKKRNPLFNKI